uniref:Uncharacterized protein n=1 Tax=Rhizophora mucronata TaxID=61149 RepID=A0A2P2NEW7_RHIMU
MGTNPNYE